MEVDGDETVTTTFTSQDVLGPATGQLSAVLDVVLLLSAGLRV